MKKCLAFVAALVSLAASATATPLPGSTPQAVNPREHFAPIRLLVTDSASRPVPGAQVRYNILPSANVILDTFAGCTFDLGYNCSAVADANGIAELIGMHAGTVAGTLSFRAMAETAFSRNDLGEATIELTVLPDPNKARLEAAYGSGSRFVIATRNGAPFAVHAVRPDGRPLANLEVRFNLSSSSVVRGSFAGVPPPYSAVVMTDANGFATSPDFIAGWGIGTGSVIATIFDPGVLDTAMATFEFTTTDPYGRTDTSFQDLWWGGASENGWGVVVAQHGEHLFNTFFVYDEAGNPTWYVQPNGGWTEGLGSTWAAVTFSPRGSPYFAYDAAQFTLGPWLTYGTFPVVSFQGPEVGALMRSTANLQPLKPLSRLDFSPGVPAPNKGIADLWWGGYEQNGWGINIMERDGNLFAVWFTYDEAGKPVWFAMEAGSWVDETTYRGVIYRVRSSPWLAAYDPARVTVTGTGSFSLHIEDLQHITFEYSFEGHDGRIPLTRLDF